MELNKENWENEVRSYNDVIVVDFWADWCMPCKMFEPVFKELANEMKDIKFGKLNVDKNQKIAEEHRIMSIPTIIIFKNGKEVKRLIGFQPKERLKKEIQEVLE